jgi:hypothetical protein
MTAQTIIKDFARSAEMSLHRENLQEMMLSFFLYTDCPDKDFRDNLIFTYRSLCDVISDVEKLEEQSV